MGDPVFSVGAARIVPPGIITLETFGSVIIIGGAGTAHELNGLCYIYPAITCMSDIEAAIKGKIKI